MNAKTPMMQKCYFRVSLPSVTRHPVPNQEISVLHREPTLNYGEQLFLYVPHMLRVNMARELAHMHWSELQG